MNISLNEVINLRGTHLPREQNRPSLLVGGYLR